VLEEIYEWAVTMVFIVYSWKDWRAKAERCPYFSLCCSGIKWVAPVLLADSREYSLQKTLFLK